MPGNIISINDWAEFYVGDSRMNELAIFLGDVGFPENKEAKKFLEDEGVEYRTTRKFPSSHVRLVHPKIVAYK